MLLGGHVGSVGNEALVLAFKNQPWKMVRKKLEVVNYDERKT